MKQTIILFLLLVNWCGYKLNAQEVYGWNLNDSYAPEEVGPCRFDINNPSHFEIIRKHDYGICAGAFAGKTYYVYTYRSNGNSSTPLAFGSYDFASGSFTEIADYSQMETLFYDMTYDYQNSIMYALGFDGSYSTLLKVNLSNGQTTTIATLSQQFVALACNLKGELFAEDIYGYLTQLDAAGNETMLDGGDIFPEMFFQSMTFDHQTEKLYWIAPTTRGGTQIVDIDPSTGWANNYNELDNERQIVGLDLPYSTVKPKAPNEITAISLQAKHLGSLTLEGSFTAPTRTADGSVLSSCEVYVLRNGVEIYKKKAVSPGEIIKFSDQVDTDGLYSYKLYAENNIGRNEEINCQIYLGIDIPAAVKNITLSKTEDGMGATINWEAPNLGMQGGYLGDLPLKYDIVRQPDGLTIASQISETTYKDPQVPCLDNYYYVITATGKAQGPEAASESVVLGEAHLLPYTCHFTNEDMVFWKIIDRNQDGVTWKRTMTTEGISCSYSNVEGDDWLVSYPLKLKQGERYKIQIEASAYSEEYPEKMGLYLGEGMSENDISSFYLIDRFVVMNEEGSKNLYTTYYTATEDMLRNFAVQMNSAPDMFALNVYNITIKAAAEGDIQGIVIDQRTQNPIEGVNIKLQSTDYSYETWTDAQGIWKLEKVTEGSYQTTFKKTGYALLKEQIEISADKQQTIQSALRKLEKITINGKITDEAGQVIPQAFITLTHQEDHTLIQTESLADGSWQVESFEGTYTCDVTALGYHTYTTTINTVKATPEIHSIVLQGKAVAPRKLALQSNESGVQLNWDAPIDITTKAYYQGEGVAHIGILMYTPHSIVGTVFRQTMALTQVSWQTDGSQGKHETVDLVIFKLDEDGEPTSTLLYEKNCIPNTDNIWSTYELEEPLIIRNGALVAFRYHGNIAMMADAGTNEGVKFMPHVHVINSDYTTNAFEYLDQHNMEKNLLIEIKSTPLTQAGTIPQTALCHDKYNVYRKNTTEETASWNWVGSTEKEVRTFTDLSFNALPMGTYQYAVTSAMVSEESEKALSALIDKDLTANVTFEISTNAGALDSDPILTIVRTDELSVPITATKVSNSVWQVSGLEKGTYQVNGTLDGFKNLKQTVNLNQKENEYVVPLEFIERLLSAYNLKVEKQEEDNTYMLTWNSDNYFFDDFESYAPFTLEPATPINNWIYWDLDKSPTVEFSNLNFKHMGEPMSYMVFNPSKTDPNLTMIDAGAQAYSGEQYLASFANPSEANKDFIFSPILSFTGKAEMSCLMKSFTNQIGQAAIRIGYTIKEFPMTEEDITWLTTPFRLSDKKWENIICDIPSEAKRMVILNQTPKAFFIMMDDLFVGEEYPYLSAENPKPVTDRADYEVKVDGNLIQLSPEHKYRACLDQLNAGTHTAEVTAIYESGRSETRCITFETSVPTNIHSGKTLNEKCFTYHAMDETIRFCTEVITWSLYDINGRLVISDNAPCLKTSLFTSGCYLLKVTTHQGTSVHKLIIE